MKRDKLFFSKYFFLLRIVWNHFGIPLFGNLVWILVYSLCCVCFVDIFFSVFKQSQILQSTLVWLSWGMSWACHMFHRLANQAGWNKCELRAIGLLICRLGVFGIFVLRSCPRGQQSLVVVPENFQYFF